MSAAQDSLLQPQHDTGCRAHPFYRDKFGEQECQCGLDFLIGTARAAELKLWADAKREKLDPPLEQQLLRDALHRVTGSPQ